LLPRRQEFKDTLRDKLNPLFLQNGLILIGIGLAALYWIDESYLDLFHAEHEGDTYIEQLVASGDTDELRMWAIIIGLLIGLSICAQTLMNRRRPESGAGIYALA
jgi:hypothetical protein